MYRYKAHRVFYIYFIQHSRRLVMKFLIKTTSVVKKNVLVNNKTIDLVPVFTGVHFHHLSFIVYLVVKHWGRWLDKIKGP